MILRSRRFLVTFSVMIATFIALIACGSTGSVAVNPTATSAPTATATTVPPTVAPTHAPPTATPAPAPGVCNASDFPTTGLSAKTNGSPDNFAVPPLTYFSSFGGAVHELGVRTDSGRDDEVAASLALLGLVGDHAGVELTRLVA